MSLNSNITFKRKKRERDRSSSYERLNLIPTITATSLEPDQSRNHKTCEVLQTDEPNGSSSKGQKTRTKILHNLCQKNE